MRSFSSRQRKFASAGSFYGKAPVYEAAAQEVFAVAAEPDDEADDSTYEESSCSAESEEFTEGHSI